MDKTLEQARLYEKAHAADGRQDRPRFHLTPYIGWMNDPNGFSYYKGAYHLFYQYNPYGLCWDSMHWGHAVSTDLLHWDYLPAALAPENDYDSFGVFSGSAAELPDGRQLLLYTGVTKEHDVDTQVQCVAIGDGRDYKKHGANPVIDKKKLPAGYDTSNFRDPKIWKAADGSFCCAAVARRKDGNGAILLYRSADGIRWDYDSVLLQNDGHWGKMWECPDFFELDGKKVVLVSPQDMCADGYRYHPGNGTVCFIGELDAAQKHFAATSDEPVDYGIDFYAPQTVRAPDGRTILIGWMQNWDTVPLSDRGSRNWFGQMCLPREISIRNGKLHQLPVRELERFRSGTQSLAQLVFDGCFSSEKIRGRCIDMELSVRPEDKDAFRSFSINLAENGTNKIVLAYNPRERLLSLDRSWSGTRRLACNTCACPLSGGDEVRLRIIMDTYSIEVFVNGGEQVLTCTFYTDAAAQGISFHSDGAVRMDVQLYGLYADERAGREAGL